MTENSGEEAAAERLEQLARQKFQQSLVAHEMATRQKTIQAMRDNNADPAYIYAYEKTGLLVFQETMDLLAPEQLEAWADAYEEYSAE